MFSLQGFDASRVEPTKRFEPLPVGLYTAVIAASELRPTKSLTGHYLSLEIHIVSGEYKGRRLWTRLNVDNPSPKAVEIAKGELSAICRAVNVMAPNDSTELHDRPMLIDVGCRKRQDNGELENVIRGYSAVSQAPKASAAGAGTPPAPWDATTVAPWEAQPQVPPPAPYVAPPPTPYVAPAPSLPGTLPQATGQVPYVPGQPTTIPMPVAPAPVPPSAIPGSQLPFPNVPLRG